VQLIWINIYRAEPLKFALPMEAIMADQSSVHLYLNWTKERIDEMDAALASLEAKAAQVKSEYRTKAHQLVGDLKTRRAEFESQVKLQAQAGEEALQAGKAKLEAQWRAFEAQVKIYFDTVGRQIEQQQATFREVAAAQLQSWRQAADAFHAAAAHVAATRRADIEAAVKQMKADAADTEVRFQKLKQAGGETWTALSAALADSRNAFDRANQAALNALKRAAGPSV
jgi:hypothetical protein